jgi:hypothetical protein
MGFCFPKEVLLLIRHAGPRVAMQAQAKRVVIPAQAGIHARCYAALARAGME